MTKEIIITLDADERKLVDQFGEPIIELRQEWNSSFDAIINEEDCAQLDAILTILKSII